jgi:transposase-like protein
MPEADVIPLELVRHLVNCPHCEQQTTQSWPGNMILFAPVKCSHCGKAFVITMNEPYI